MKRSLYNKLYEWKNSKDHKPLLLQGARQVGKTYLVKQLGQNEYKQFISLNFEQDPGLKTLFHDGLNPQTIIENIGIYIGKRITSEALLFFDEIQTAPEALTSLKYFYEQMPDYHIIAAGSLLGVSVGKSTSFPVGKINFLRLYPMSFIEYLLASGEELLTEKICSMQKIEPLTEVIHNKLIRYYKQYLYIGGMPEAVKDYIENKDVASVRNIQNEILEAYKRDKNSGTMAIYSVPIGKGE